MLPLVVMALTRSTGKHFLNATFCTDAARGMLCGIAPCMSALPRRLRTGLKVPVVRNAQSLGVVGDGRRKSADWPNARSIATRPRVR